MSKVLKKEPISRTQQRVFNNGVVSKRCFSPANPQYYKTSKGEFYDIDQSYIEEIKSNRGAALLRSKNISSVGILKGSNKEKFMGIRPDDTQALNTQSIEFSIDEVVFDGKKIEVDISKCDPIFPYATDLGNVVIYSDRRSVRQLFEVNNNLNSSFKIIQRLDITELRLRNKIVDGIYLLDKAGQFVIEDYKGNFKYRIALPKFLDKEFKVLPGSKTTHSLKYLSSGQYEYIKSSLPGNSFEDVKYIDADIYYAEASDVSIVYADETSWTNCRNGTTGDSIAPGESGTYQSIATYQAVTEDDWSIRRGWFAFDTNGVGEVASARVGIVFDSDNIGDDVFIQKGTQADTPTVNDFDSLTTPFLGDVAIANGNPSHDYIIWESGELDEINTSGLTKICLRSDNDYNNTSPPADDTNYDVNYYPVEQTGTTKDPFLEITETSSSSSSSSLSSSCSSSSSSKSSSSCSSSSSSRSSSSLSSSSSSSSSNCSSSSKSSSSSSLSSSSSSKSSSSSSCSLSCSSSCSSSSKSSSCSSSSESSSCSSSSKSSSCSSSSFSSCSSSSSSLSSSCSSSSSESSSSSLNSDSGTLGTDDTPADKNNTYGSSYTVIYNEAQPYNAWVTKIEIYKQTAGSHVIDFATFSKIIDSFTDEHAIEGLSIEQGLNTYEVFIDFWKFQILENEYFGVYCADFQLEDNSLTDPRPGVWRDGGDQIGSGSPSTYTFFDDHDLQIRITFAATEPSSSSSSSSSSLSSSSSSLSSSSSSLSSSSCSSSSSSFSSSSSSESSSSRSSSSYSLSSSSSSLSSLSSSSSSLSSSSSSSSSRSSSSSSSCSSSSSKSSSSSSLSSSSCSSCSSCSSSESSSSSFYYISELEFYDSTDATEQTNFLQVALTGKTTSPVQEIHLWSSKDDPIGGVATNIKISVSCSNGEYSGQDNSLGQEAVTEKWIEVKSDGVVGSGIVDDAQSVYTAIGGGFTGTKYLSVGNIPANTARKLFIRTNVPSSPDSDGTIYPRITIQYDVESSSSSSSSSSS